MEKAEQRDMLESGSGGGVWIGGGDLGGMGGSCFSRVFTCQPA